MRKLIISAIMTIFASTFAHAQRSNDQISSLIHSLKAEKNIELTYDEAGGTSKIMVPSDNFDGKEVSRAGIQAMSFGMAFFYPGKTLLNSPETFNLTFWVLAKKPHFAVVNRWIVTIGNESLDLGELRYAAKPGENMEYLNARIARADLARIAAGSNVRFKLGTAEFTFTAAHLAVFKNLLAVSDIR